MKHFHVLLLKALDWSKFRESVVLDVRKAFGYAKAFGYDKGVWLKLTCCTRQNQQDDDKSKYKA